MLSSSVSLNLFIFSITTTICTWALVKCPGKCIQDISECRQLGGRILGYCVQGEACCDYGKRRWASCGGIQQDKVIYFRSPNYPKRSSGDLICQFQLQLMPSTVGVRLDFEDLKMDKLPTNLTAELLGSGTPVCGSDMMFLRGFRGWSPDPRCGNLTGYSILVEREKNQDKLSIVFVMASSDYKWNIRLTQILQPQINTLYSLMFNKGVPSDLDGKKEVSDEDSNSNKLSFTGYPRPPYGIPPYGIGPTFGFGPGPPPSAYFPFSGHGKGSNLNSTEEGTKKGEQLKFPQARISGGENAEGNAIPWQVSIQIKEPLSSILCGAQGQKISSHICGGSIIDERSILTAAHCFYSASSYPSPVDKISSLKIVVGDLDLCSENEVLFTKEYEIERVILHYNYISTFILNDIVVIRVKEPIVFNQGVAPIPMADQDLKLSSVDPLLSGWGSMGVIEVNMTFPKVLQKTSNLILIPEEECAQRQKAYLRLTTNDDKPSKKNDTVTGKYIGAYDNGICVRGKSPLVEAGYGDSGGPLVGLSKKGEISSYPLLIGIVSHMRPETDEKNESFHLDYFTKVSEYRNWILMGMISD